MAHSLHGVGVFMDCVWALFQKYPMPYPVFLRGRGRWEANCCLERRRRALDNSCYGTQGCHATLQPLCMGHFLTALATGPAADRQKRAIPWSLLAHTFCYLNTKHTNNFTQIHSPSSLPLADSRVLPVHKLKQDRTVV